MRILVALGEDALPECGEPASAAAGRRIGVAAAALAELAREHELVVTNGREGESGRLLELALRNALPGRDVITVCTGVVVGTGGAGGAPEPHGVPELPTLRLLIEAATVVICTDGGASALTVNGMGEMRRVDAPVDPNLTAALLARRLEADLFLVLVGGDGVGHEHRAEARACRRFVETSGRHAAMGLGPLAAELARGRVGTQFGPGIPDPGGAPAAFANPS